jgi:hypothetical protein
MLRHSNFTFTERREGKRQLERPGVGGTLKRILEKYVVTVHDLSQWGYFECDS